MAKTLELTQDPPPSSNPTPRGRKLALAIQIEPHLKEVANMGLPRQDMLAGLSCVPLSFTPIPTKSTEKSLDKAIGTIQSWAWRS